MIRAAHDDEVPSGFGRIMLASVRPSGLALKAPQDVSAGQRLGFYALFLGAPRRGVGNRSRPQLLTDVIGLIYGTERLSSAPTGRKSLFNIIPRALPWAEMLLAVGAQESVSDATPR
jgi:hypothetical protein